MLAPGRSLGGVALGASRAEVAAAWGPAYGRCRDCPRETLYFNRIAFRPEGAGVRLRNGRVVVAFTLWAPPAWRTSGGLWIGEPASRLGDAHPGARRVACDGYAGYVLSGGGPRSVVYVLDGRVWGFALLGGGTPVCL